MKTPRVNGIGGVFFKSRDPDALWVFPMDGTQAWPRTSPGGRPAVYASRDGGEAVTLP